MDLQPKIENVIRTFSEDMVTMHLTDLPTLEQNILIRRIHRSVVDEVTATIHEIKAAAEDDLAWSVVKALVADTTNQEVTVKRSDMARVDSKAELIVTDSDVDPDLLTLKLNYDE